jgi:RNA polymerase sigma factor (sigma-70 family)
MSEAAVPRRVAPSLDATRLLSDERLVARATRGDERAFAAIYRRYHQQLYRFSLAIVGNPEDAQDALQNTMVKAMGALPGERRAIRLKPWLYRIAHNESIELLRRRRQADELDPEAPTRLPGPAEKAEQRLRLRRLVADMRELPDRQRAALVMRELAGLGFEEIGAALETTPAVARQTLYEARLSLRQMEEGREMSCGSVTRALSDDDGRVIRRRDLRAHLRHCAQCREFRDELRRRRSDLAAISPLPAAAAAGILQAMFGAGGTGTGGGGLAGALGGGAAKVFGTSAAVKSAATVAVVAAVGVTAADRGGLIAAGLPGGEAAKPARGAPKHPGIASEAPNSGTAAAAAVRPAAPGALGAAAAVDVKRRAVAAGRPTATARQDGGGATGNAPQAVPAAGAPGESGSHRNDAGRHGTPPAAAAHGPVNAAGHSAGKGSGGMGKGSGGRGKGSHSAAKPHPVHPTKPVHPGKPEQQASNPPATNGKSAAPAALESEKPAAPTEPPDDRTPPAERTNRQISPGSS